MVFPEGVRGINKPWSQRYRLQRFGLGFVRLALAAGAPIVPVGIVGSEEQQPGLANLEGLARVLGMPSFPITLPAAANCHASKRSPSCGVANRSTAGSSDCPAPSAAA